MDPVPCSSVTSLRTAVVVVVVTWMLRSLLLLHTGLGRSKRTNKGALGHSATCHSLTHSLTHNIHSLNITQQQQQQFSASKPIDVNTKFDLVPDDCTGTRRALLIGINYVGHSPGELSGCHNDVGNMIEYIKNVHGFQESNITVLLDKEGYTQPTKANIEAAYKTLVAQTESGDALFCHYSGHGYVRRRKLLLLL